MSNTRPGPYKDAVQIVLFDPDPDSEIGLKGNYGPVLFNGK